MALLSCPVLSPFRPCSFGEPLIQPESLPGISALPNFRARSG